MRQNTTPQRSQTRKSSKYDGNSEDVRRAVETDSNNCVVPNDGSLLPFERSAQLQGSKCNMLRDRFRSLQPKINEEQPEYSLHPQTHNMLSFQIHPIPVTQRITKKYVLSLNHPLCNTLVCSVDIRQMSGYRK